MLLPNVTEILNDPEIGGGVSFQVIRNTSVRKRGGYEKTPTIYQATGNIQPQEMSNQSSTVEDALNESITIYSTFPFQTGSNTGTAIVEADIVVYDNLHWRVTSVDDWSKWGYTKANAVRVRDIIVQVVPEETDSKETGE